MFGHKKATHVGKLCGPLIISWTIAPGPSTPDQKVPIFAKKGYFFQWVWVGEIFEKSKILHVFISICFLRIIEFLCINVFEL